MYFKFDWKLTYQGRVLSLLFPKRKMEKKDKKVFRKAIWMVVVRSAWAVDRSIYIRAHLVLLVFCIKQAFTQSLNFRKYLFIIWTWYIFVFMNLLGIQNENKWKIVKWLGWLRVSLYRFNTVTKSPCGFILCMYTRVYNNLPSINFILLQYISVCLAYEMLHCGLT